MTSAPPKSSKLLAIFRFIVLAVWLLFVVLLALPLYILRRYKTRAALVHIFFSVACLIVGLRVKQEGAFSSERPLLLVTNHCSYLDIFVIASCLPISFTPKSDIADWPVIGFLCKLADCVFVERRPAKMKQAQAEMLKRINRGKALCLFPEGTTNEGLEPKPFKSGFFTLAEPAEDRPALPTQPATILYTHINGKPIQNQDERGKIAWYGDAELMPHLLAAMGFYSITVEVLVGPVLRHEEGVGRKEICKQSEELISGAIQLRHQQITQEAA